MWLSRCIWSGYLAYHLRGQARFPFQSLETITRVQTQRVQRMVWHAYRTVPYYRETMDRLGLHPGDVHTADDLAKLPVVERDQLQRHPEHFLSTAQLPERCLQVHSGGSSGTPCTVYHNAAAVFQNAAQGERERAMITALVGQSFGYRETVFMVPQGTAQDVQQFCQKRGFFPSSVRIQRQYLSLLDSPEKNVPLVNAFQPDVMSSYGSYLEMLFFYLHSTGQPLHRPKVILYSSDGLSEAARRLITETFGIPIISTYEAIEAFKIGFACTYGLGIHLNIDLYPVRIVNAQGGSLPTGESGDVVISNLVNRATVLLNYRLGDLACMLPGPCPCGRALPLLSLPQGRSDDWLHLASGQILHPQAVMALYTDIQEIWQYQVVQESLSAFRVAIVAAPTVDRQDIARRLVRRLQQALGQHSTVQLTFVDRLERTASGKLRPVISKLQHRYAYRLRAEENT